MSGVAYSGVLYRIYRWNQRLFDGSMKLYEKAYAPSAVSVIPITKDRRVILVKEMKVHPRHPRLTLPRGFVNKGETPAEAAKRELLEEAGAKAKIYRLIKRTGIISAYFNWKLFYFVALESIKIRVPLDRPGEKIIETVQIDLPEFLRMVVSKDINLPFIEADLVRAYYNKKAREELFRSWGILF